MSQSRYWLFLCWSGTAPGVDVSQGRSWLSKPTTPFDQNHSLWYSLTATKCIWLTRNAGPNVTAKCNNQQDTIFIICMEQPCKHGITFTSCPPPINWLQHNSNYFLSHVDSEDFSWGWCRWRNQLTFGGHSWWFVRNIYTSERHCTLDHEPVSYSNYFKIIEKHAYFLFLSFLFKALKMSQDKKQFVSRGCGDKSKLRHLAHVLRKP